MIWVKKKKKCSLCLFLDRIDLEIMFDDHLVQKRLPFLDYKNIHFT